MGESTTPASDAPILVVSVEASSYTVEPRHGPITIGRTATAGIQVDDRRVSREHVRLEPREGSWRATDTSSNGIYVTGHPCDAVTITDGMTIHLGNAEGIPVHFAFARPPETQPPTNAEGDAGDDMFEDEEDSLEFSEVTDRGLALVAQAVRARRDELEFTMRGFAKAADIAQGTVIGVEQARRWPQSKTRASIEKALQWPEGTLEKIREGAPTTDEGETTEVIVDASALAQTVELAMHAITSAIASLPKPTDPEFTTRANRVLADLRKLENVAAHAARSAKGASQGALALSGVRRTYNELMLQAARSPSASLGQRLYAARSHANLTAQETAAAVGVPADTILAAEAENRITADAASAIESFINQLTAAGR